MKYKGLAVALFSIFILISSTEASNKKFKVLFVIPPTSETALASETRSYITRELRALQDVELVTEDPSLEHFFISIFPVSLKLSDGRTAGIAVSYVFERKEKVYHSVLIGPANGLKTLCEKLIAYFDTEVRCF